MAGDDAFGGTNKHVVIDGCSADEPIVVDNKNRMISPVHQMLVGLWDNPAHSLCIVPKLIRPHPLRCWYGRLGAHNSVHHPSRRSPPMVPVVMAWLAMYSTHITNGIDDVNIGAVDVVNNDTVINADTRILC